ncbi:MAG: A24 family peptidase [Planctomycetota bacterium]
MITLVTLWWLAFWTAVGLAVGSFLNAVIFRLPRGRSLRSPVWSACPHCRRRIQWFDNVPILSFINLRGRCRHCGVPIATSYLVVEAAMAVIVLMLLDAFMIGAVREGLSRSPVGLTERLALDWPILVAHVVLMACLFAMSAIDLEHYWVDIRFTNFVVVCGFILHVIWTPRHSAAWPRPSDATSAMSLLACLGLGLAALLWMIHREPIDPDEPVVSEDPPPEPSTEPAGHPPRRPPPSLASPSRAAGWVAVLLVVALLGALGLTEANDVPLRHSGRALIPLMFLFGIVLLQSTISRESDVAIMEAIHQERHSARGMVLAELVLLLPAVSLGILGLWLMLHGGPFSDRVSSAIHTEVNVGWLTMMRSWQPLHGLATAATGYAIAGALGWAIRIAFTLLFGKEAFGVGDIHLMAAAGCVAGWPVVALAFVLTCVISLVGWLATLPFKRTRALPLGPWLSLSILVVVVFYDPMVRWPPISRAVEVAQWYGGRISQPAGPEKRP